MEAKHVNAPNREETRFGSATRMEARNMSTLQVVRIVVRGWTYRRRDSDNYAEARAMLSRAFASDRWPSAPATVAITPGGFIQASLPRNYKGAKGWNSKKHDLCKLIPHAEAAVHAVVQGDVLKNARQRTRFLTLGVDLNVERHKEDRLQGDHRCRPACPEACTHAELVANLDTAGKVAVLDSHTAGDGPRHSFSKSQGDSLDRQVLPGGFAAAHAGSCDGPRHSFSRNRL